MHGNTSQISKSDPEAPLESSAGDRGKRVKPVRQSQITGGKVLSDGSLLELLRNSQEKESFLLKKPDDTQQSRREVVVDGTSYSPCSANLISYLPSEPSSYGSTCALYESVEKFIKKYSGVEPNDAALLTFFSIASYFPECSNWSPALLISGHPTAAISTMQVLGCVCRHSIFAIGSDLDHLPADLGATIIIGDPGPGIERRLAAMQLPGFHQLHVPERQASSVVIFVGDRFPCSPFAETCLRFSAYANRNSLVGADAQKETESIVHLQNQLLSYRLQNFLRIKESRFDDPEFSGIAREHMRTLGRCIVDAPDVLNRLKCLIRAEYRAERTDRASQLDAIVVEALLVVCHERRKSAHVRELTKIVNAILTRSKEHARVNDRLVGAILKHLGFRTQRLDAAGRGLYLLRDNCGRIHELARSLGSATTLNPLPGCEFCNGNEP